MKISFGHLQFYHTGGQNATIPLILVLIRKWTARGNNNFTLLPLFRKQTILLLLIFVLVHPRRQFQNTVSPQKGSREHSVQEYIIIPILLLRTFFTFPESYIMGTIKICKKILILKENFRKISKFVYNGKKYWSF